MLLGSSGVQTFSITNGGTAPLHISGLQTAAPFAVVSPATPFQVGANASATVTVTFSPSSTGAQTGTLIITSDDPNNGSVTVSLSGTGSAPRIGVNPSSLTFGNATVGQSATMNLTLANQGTATLNVKSLTVIAPFAVVSPATPFQVAANSSATVTLSFSPTVAGAQTGTLSIASDDPVNSSLTVALNGNGAGSASLSAIPRA